jgi:signal transduction histidine kinase
LISEDAFVPNATTTSPAAQKDRIAEVAAAIWRGLCALTILFTTAGVAGGAEPPRVLMLFANDRLLPANQRVDEGFRRALDPQGNQTSVTIFTEFLDVPRLVGAGHEQMMEEYLERRYKDVPPDVLVVVGVEAVDFWFSRRDRLFPGTPVVFGAVGVEEFRSLDGLSGVTGLPMDISVTPVVESLLAMRPQTRRIVLVHGSADYDRSWRDIALRQCRPFADRVEITVLPELPLEELKVRLAALPADSAVIYLSYFQSPTGETYTPARVAQEIAAASAVPVMGPYDTYLGSGVLGVACSQFEDDGVAIGKLAQRVLSGERPESIGILPPNPARLIVDERQVKRWGIKSLPAGTDVRFHTPTLWEERRGFIIATVAVVALQAALIAGLLAQRAWRRQSEREIRDVRQELTHAGRVSMLGQLSTSLAHELSQPLGAILRNAEAAELFLQQEQPDLDELREIVADIRKDDHRAGQVIDRLRGLLKRQEVQLRPVALHELIEDVHMLLHADRVRRHVEVVLDVPKSLPLVHADRIHLQQVLLNLKVNAFEALAEINGDPRKIAVCARVVDSRFVEITVEDNGPGIPPDKMEHLFEPFFTTKGHGMGFGLSICRTIIEAHRGKLTAENREPHGAVFKITLPIEKEARDEGRGVREGSIQ